MKDGIRAEEQVDVSRQELYEDYMSWYLHLCTEVQPCRDAGLLRKAARYLLREPELRGAFTVFPFYQAVSEGCGALSSDCRKLLSAFIKATELLETLCVNLFLQPWRKEIRTLKTFTGPFVYCLLPVFSSSTIQSVLASIGYLPHPDAPQSEYRLSEAANADTAMLVGFELLLARVECHHLLELLEKDQLGPQEWLEVFQKRAGPTKPQEELTEKKTTTGQKEEEKKKEEEEEEEEADQKEVPLHLAFGHTGNPPAKPRRTHQISIDQSIMEMQRNYPDLAIRGRRLLSDNSHRANSSRSTASTKAAKLPTRASVKDTKAGATALRSKGDSSSKADEVFGCNGRSGGQTTALGDTTGSSFSNTDGNRVDDELSPQCVSLHITLRAGATAHTAEPPAWTQQQTTADLQNKRPVSPEHTSLSSMEEERDLRELAERMGQLHVQEPKEEVKRKEENKREEESTSKERRKIERKASAEGEAKEQNLRRPVMETGPLLSCAAGRCTRSSQSNPALMKEQRQPAVCQPTPLSVSTADCQSCTGGQQEGDSERAETGRGEEEELAEEYCIL
ncbi:uncharacterized protein si:ch211-189a15.5 isoform X2 [Dicentrarchus labrax]|uniref:uncharacterized protein si:ch211-189a15.5 isoform X2 n=1 Tax=Dicentrarchus labrax TaxID=13489 RepID=UPI0021F5DEB3|nr:uncharacterized protein si:ch211-189a15.5 isoform X2 [Dicentrarchus labrax]